MGIVGLELAMEVLPSMREQWSTVFGTPYISAPLRLSISDSKLELMPSYYGYEAKPYDMDKLRDFSHTTLRGPEASQS